MDVEIEAENSWPRSSGVEFERKSPLSASSFAPVRQGFRTKSSQRLKYEAEVSALRRRIGGLEDMRHRLGLSQRKMAQLLLVDPSAWTRWTRDGEDAPPIVYRALQWFLALEEKYPALDPQFWLQTVARVESGSEARQRENEQQLANISRLEKHVSELERRLQDIDNEMIRTKSSRLSREPVVRLGLLVFGLVLGFALARWH